MKRRGSSSIDNTFSIGRQVSTAFTAIANTVRDALAAHGAEINERPTTPEWAPAAIRLGMA